MTFDHALMSGARWLRRRSWHRRRPWVYVTSEGELVGLREADRTADDWLVSHRVPQGAPVEITAAQAVREKKKLRDPIE